MPRIWYTISFSIWFCLHDSACKSIRLISLPPLSLFLSFSPTESEAIFCSPFSCMEFETERVKITERTVFFEHLCSQPFYFCNLYNCKLITESKQHKHSNMKEKKGGHFLFFNRTYSCYFHSVTRKHTQSIVWTWKLNKGWILLKFQSPRTSLYPGKCMDSTVFFLSRKKKTFSNPNIKRHRVPHLFHWMISIAKSSVSYLRFNMRNKHNIERISLLCLLYCLILFMFLHNFFTSSMNKF